MELEQKLMGWQPHRSWPQMGGVCVQISLRATTFHDCF